MPKTRSALSRLLSRLGLSLLGLLAGLALAEGALRLAGPAWRPGWAERATFWRHDPELGWSHRPGQRGIFSGRDFRVQVVINALGLRDRERGYERAPDGAARRVLLLGDSYGWGYGVERDSSFAGRLERPGREVVNGSVSGYGTAQELLWYRREGRRYHPDLVLLLVSDNDVVDNCGPSIYWYRKPYFTLEGDSLGLHGVPVPPPTVKERLRVWVLGRTYLGSALRGLWWRARGALVPVAERAGVPVSPGHPEAPTDSSCHRATRALLRALAGAIGADGARPALAVGPMPAALAAWWREQAQALDVPVMDLNGRFHDRAPIYLTGDPHWNARGHRRAAESLGPWLDSLLAAPPAAGRPS